MIPTDISALRGDLACLRYAHEHGAPWHEWTTAYAAINGHLECLRYAHEHGAPWDECTTGFAASHGQLECLRYAYIRGCPWIDDGEARSRKVATAIAEWNRAASTISRAWRRHHDGKRRMAVSVIEAAWLAHTYAPGGKGYARLAEAWMDAHVLESLSTAACIRCID